jgi:hypothetical protein
VNRRKLTRALGPKDLRQFDAAAHAAEKAGVPLTVMLTVHLGLLDSARHDPGAYIRRGVVNRLGVWLRRRDIKLTAIWVQENFDGPAREHLHLLAHIPKLRTKHAARADPRSSGRLPHSSPTLRSGMSPEADVAMRAFSGSRAVR